MARTLEIERKYWLSALPDWVYTASHAIEQGYIERGDYSVRLRRKRTGSKEPVCKLNHKQGQGLTRIEHEEPISNEAFELLWPLTEGHRLVKTRHYYRDQHDQLWEVDEYDEELAGLYTAELEMPAEDYTVSLPEALRAVLKCEVTGDPAYLNITLARRSTSAG